MQPTAALIEFYVKSLDQFRKAARTVRQAREQLLERIRLLETQAEGAGADEASGSSWQLFKESNPPDQIASTLIHMLNHNINVTRFCDVLIEFGSLKAEDTLEWLYKNPPSVPDQDSEANSQH